MCIPVILRKKKTILKYLNILDMNISKVLILSMRPFIKNFFINLTLTRIMRFFKKEILKKWQTLYKSHTLFDLEFRIIRDHVITHHQYEIIMFEMLKEKNIDYLNLPQKLQMKKKFN